MKKAEIILIVLMVLGIIMKLLHYPFSSLVFLLAASSLATIYFYFGFALLNGVRMRNMFKKVSYQEIGVKKILFAVGVGLALGVLLIGILFKIQHWPAADMQLSLGFYSCIVALIIALVFYAKTKESIFKNVLVRTIFFGCIGAVLVFTAPKTLLTWQYPDHPEYVEACMELDEDPTNLELQQKVQRLNEAMFEEKTNPKQIHDE